MTIYSFDILFPNLEPVFCSMSSSNCYFLTYIQITQDAGPMVWYSHLLKNFQFVVIHAVTGFGIVNKEETDVFLELSCFFDDPTDAGNLIWFLLLLLIQLQHLEVQGSRTVEAWLVGF